MTAKIPSKGEIPLKKTTKVCVDATSEPSAEQPKKEKPRYGLRGGISEEQVGDYLDRKLMGKLEQKAKEDEHLAKLAEDSRPIQAFERVPIERPQISETRKTDSDGRIKQRALKRQYMDDVPDDYVAPEPLIEGMLQQGEATMLFGGKGSMKSFFNFAAGYALATGTHPFEPDAEFRTHTFRNTRKGKRTRALFVTTEMNLQQLQVRYGVKWKEEVKDTEGRKEANGKPLEWLSILTVNREPLLKGAERSSVLENIHDALREAQDIGYPYEAVLLDNVTTLWPSKLSDNEGASWVADQLQNLCSEEGEFGCALMYTMHLNKLTAGLGYERIDVNQMKGNAFFSIVNQREIGVNRSTIRKNGVYCIHEKDRMGDEDDSLHRKRCATFTVQPTNPSLGKKSPVRLVYEGFSTEAAERGKEEAPSSVTERWAMQWITDNLPDATYAKFETAWTKEFKENSPPSSSTFNRMRDRCRQATGRTEQMKIREDERGK